MPFGLKNIFPKSKVNVLEGLSSLKNVEGVTDYFLLDNSGKVISKVSNLGFDDDLLLKCSYHIAQANTVSNLFALSFKSNIDYIYFYFRNGLALIWDFGNSNLVILCKEIVDLSMVRMTVNIFKQQARKDKRFKKYFEKGESISLNYLNEEILGRYLYKHLKSFVNGDVNPKTNIT